MTGIVTAKTSKLIKNTTSGVRAHFDIIERAREIYMAQIKRAEADYYERIKRATAVLTGEEPVTSTAATEAGQPSAN